MNIQNARFTIDSLELTIDGKLAYVDTKKSLLDAGIAVLLDPDPDEPHWDNTLSATWPCDEADGRAELRIRGGTTDPAVVGLARRYWHAVNSADFKEGDVAL